MCPVVRLVVLSMCLVVGVGVGVFVVIRRRRSDDAAPEPALWDRRADAHTPVPRAQTCWTGDATDRPR